MMRSSKSRLLRQSDLLRALEVAPHLYAPCAATQPAFALNDRSSVLAYPIPSNEWRDAVVDVLYAAVDGIDCAVYNVLNTSSGKLEEIVSRRVSLKLSQAEQLQLQTQGATAIHADPAYRRAREALPSGNVLIDSDFQTVRQIVSSRAYREYYRPIQVRFQMAFAIPSDRPGFVTFAAAMRWDRPFTERDRALGALLQEHIRRAHAARCSRETSMAKTLESMPQSSLDALGLSQRQTEVYYWLACGKRDSEIATILGTSPRTVNNHVAAIYQRLGVENRASAIRLALETALRPAN